MWYRVVNVENVEIKPGHHFCHLCGENQIVWRVFEAWIREHFHFVKVHVVTHRQANGKCIADEVNVMSPPGQFLSKFGCDNAAASVRGIARDADLHISMT